MKLQLGIVCAGVALATLGTGAAQAALVVVPTGLNPGDQYRLVFVTDGTRDATSTNIGMQQAPTSTTTITLLPAR